MKNEAYLARLLERIAAKTQIGPGCWEWLGLKDKDGYAVIYSRETDNNVRASRLIWTIERGPIATGILVLHTCDNPACVRLAHLFLGTTADNVRDKIAKGRARYAPRRRVWLICQNCSRPFWVRQHRETTAKFCSIRCRRA